MFDICFIMIMIMIMIMILIMIMTIISQSRDDRTGKARFGRSTD
jgi:hypothetical protein